MRHRSWISKRDKERCGKRKRTHSHFFLRNTMEQMIICRSCVLCYMKTRRNGRMNECTHCKWNMYVCISRHSACTRSFHYAFIRWCTWTKGTRVFRRKRETGHYFCFSLLLVRAFQTFYVLTDVVWLLFHPSIFFWVSLSHTDRRIFTKLPRESYREISRERDIEINWDVFGFNGKC